MTRGYCSIFRCSIKRLRLLELALANKRFDQERGKADVLVKPPWLIRCPDGEDLDLGNNRESGSF